MPRPELVLDGFVVFRLLVGVSHQQTDRRTGGASLEHAGKYFHLIRFVTLRGVARGSAAPPIHLMLDVGLSQCHSRRATIHDAAKRRAVALAKTGNHEQAPETVTGHAQPDWFCLIL